MTAVLVWVPAAVAASAMVLSRTGPLSPLLWWDVAWTAAAVSALAGTVAARRRAAPANRERWTLWAGASGCWLVGQLAWDVFGLRGFPQSPNLADFAWWGFALLVMISLVAQHRRCRGACVWWPWSRRCR